MVTDRESRYKTIEQFKSHPWFTGIEWDHIRNQTPPYQPKFSGPDDTSNFDISDIKPINNSIAPILGNKDVYVELSFVGFTSTFTGKSANQINENKYKDSENLVIESESSEEKNQDNLEDNKNKILILENRVKSAQQEWSEMSHLLAEMKKEKNALSNKLRLKEGELDEHIEKNSQLRQQLRNYEKIKRQHLEEIANLQAELDTQTILHKQGKMTENSMYLEYLKIHIYSLPNKIKQQ